MKNLKGVLVSAGYFAQFQAEAWRRLETQSPLLAAVADTTPGKARAFSEKFGIPRAYESVEEALDKEKPDFVDIATRPESHLELTRLAASRGIHVICQKPMAPTWEQCVAMVETCEAAKVRLLMHENWRWQPWYRELKRLLDARTIGSPFQIACFWRTGDGLGPAPYPTQPYFKDMAHLLVYETLVHPLDTFRFLFGEIQSVFCQNRRINPAIIGEDQSLIQVTFVDGRLGLIDANRISGSMPAPVAMSTLVVDGDGGALRVSPDGRLWLAVSGQNEQRLPFEPPTTGYKGDSVLATQSHLLECLRTGQPSESDGCDYLRTVALVEACYESAANGNVVRVGNRDDWKS